jgi:DNA-binding MarR family transcriptional regulator
MSGSDNDGVPVAFREAAALRAGLRRFLRQSEAITRDCGLTVEQYELLLLIKLSPGGRATIGDLHQGLVRRQSGVTQLARRAENLGLVKRELSRDDARVRYLRLTRRGEERLTKAVANLGRERARLLSILAELESAGH